MTWDGNTLAKLSATARVTETDAASGKPAKRSVKIQLAVRAGDADGLRFHVRQSDLHAHHLQASVLHAADFTR